MEITGSTPARVEVDLGFLKPFKATNVTDLRRSTPAAAGRPRSPGTWRASATCSCPLMGKLFFDKAIAQGLRPGPGPAQGGLPRPADRGARPAPLGPESAADSGPSGAMSVLPAVMGSRALRDDPGGADGRSDAGARRRCAGRRPGVAAAADLTRSRELIRRVRRRVKVSQRELARGAGRRRSRRWRSGRRVAARRRLGC